MGIQEVFLKQDVEVNTAVVKDGSDRLCTITLPAGTKIFISWNDYLKGVEDLNKTQSGK